jgi:hypothetical protein
VALEKSIKNAMENPNKKHNKKISTFLLLLNINSILILLSCIIHFMNKEFERGFKSVFSFASNDRTRERIAMLSVEDRLRRNWENVGNDIRKSMNTFDLELKRDK